MVDPTIQIYANRNTRLAGMNPSAEEKMEPQASIEMPRYKSHKIVHALKIRKLEPIGPWATMRMTPEDSRYAPITLDDAFVNKHRPQEEGYYVVYPDGYKSFSSCETFEDDYTAC